ncbi:MAG: exodeoxyribonuclease III [Gammaproteobacteria bacterium]|nr:exodeoxyribonuclease III [Gammaproteobacteria bacterium]
MRVISLNANGIRAAARKGFFSWMTRQKADVICLQETRANPEQIEDRVYHPRSFHNLYHPAERRGYSGVAIYSRREPDELISGFSNAGGDAGGWQEFDAEGRYIEARFGQLSVVSLYAPSGSSHDDRQASKFRFLDLFMPLLQKFRESGREYIICGDWNIAHKAIDLKNWKANQKNSGFLPEERAWMDQLMGPVGYVDAFRRVNQKEDQYTWWSNRGRAWDNNVGWRIDYQIVTPGMGELVSNAKIYRRKRFSDHAPLTIDYDYDV